MGEVGCLKDGAFQNLKVEGNTNFETVTANSLTVEGLVSIGNVSPAAIGLEGVVSAASVLTATAAANTDLTCALPAGAIITDLGFIVTSQIVTGDTNAADDLTLAVGLTAGGTEFVASTDISDRNKTLLVGTMQSVSQQNKAEAASTAIPAFADATVLYSATTRNAVFRFTPKTNDLQTPGAVRVFVKYTVVGA